MNGHVRRIPRRFKRHNEWVEGAAERLAAAHRRVVEAGAVDPVVLVIDRADPIGRLVYHLLGAGGGLAARPCPGLGRDPAILALPRRRLVAGLAPVFPRLAADVAAMGLPGCHVVIVALGVGSAHAIPPGPAPTCGPAA
jgi:hypothetical protein